MPSRERSWRCGPIARIYATELTQREVHIEYLSTPPSIVSGSVVLLVGAILKAQVKQAFMAWTSIGCSRACPALIPLAAPR